MTKLFDPEDNWVSGNQVRIISRAEVEKCIGPTSEHLQLLSGGQANTNIRIGDDRVLRLYRRDTAIAGKELALIQKPWKNLVVPEVLASGPGFLLSKYVKHSPLEDAAMQGEALGKALAEIHSRTYPTGGFVNSQLELEDPMDDFVEDMWGYLCSFEEDLKPALDEDLYGDVLEVFDDNLEALKTVAGSNVLLHGDFKVSNLHWTEQSKPLVLDWEFAYVGSALMDIGQLFRWPVSTEFENAFVLAYKANGGQLAEGWKGWVQILDLINLVGWLQVLEKGSPKALDVTARIQKTVAANLKGTEIHD